MADTTSIEWVVAAARAQAKDARVWNPIRGCRPISEGCRHCWAAKVAGMRKNHPNARIRGRYEGLTTRSADGRTIFNGGWKTMDDDLHLPMDTQRPSVFFIGSETDLFGEGVADIWLDRVIAVMAMAPRHTFLLLTKRPDRAMDYLAGNRPLEITSAAIDLFSTEQIKQSPLGHAGWWPLSNVVIGASVENQTRAHQRQSPMMAMAMDGWRTWASNEPALGPVDWTGWEFITWLVTGGESGTGARPMHLDWARSARDWAKTNQIAFFFKQWGEWRPMTPAEDQTTVKARTITVWPDGLRSALMGKSHSGRILDRRIHDYVPDWSYHPGKMSLISAQTWRDQAPVCGAK